MQNPTLSDPSPSRLLRMAPLLLVGAFLLTLASCEALSSWLGPSPPPTGEVSAWGDLELILATLEGRTGDTPEIDALQVELSDPDGDAHFPLESLRPLIEPQTWAAGFSDPLALYISICEADFTLSPAGLESRRLAANQLRDSIRGILTD